MNHSLIAKENLKRLINTEYKVFHFETRSNFAQFLLTNVVVIFMYMYISQEVVQGWGLGKNRAILA